jgi:hypothetical protein
VELASAVVGTGLSTGTTARLVGTLHLAARAACAPALSAATSVADRPGAILRAEAPVLAAVAFTVAAVAVVAGIDNRSLVGFRKDAEN